MVLRMSMHDNCIIVLPANFDYDFIALHTGTQQLQSMVLGVQVLKVC